MKKCKALFASILMLFALGFSITNTENTHAAATDYIKTITNPKHEGRWLVLDGIKNQYYSKSSAGLYTKFTFDLAWGDLCKHNNSVICSMESTTISGCTSAYGNEAKTTNDPFKCSWGPITMTSNFWCGKSGAPELSGVGSWTVTYKNKDSNYEYYNVTVNPSISSQQTAVGTMRRQIIPKYHLRGGIRDSSGNYISGYNDWQWDEEVSSGATPSIDAKSIPGYTFLYWWSGAGTSSSDYLGTNTRYTAPAMTSDRNVYAVYGKNPTLTFISIDREGNELKRSTPTVWYNGSGTVEAEAIAGYTRKCFILDDINGKSVNDDTKDRSNCSGMYASTGGTYKYTINNMTTDRTIYAVYELNTFSGRVDAKDVSTNRSATTDWKEDDTTINKYIKCAVSTDCSVEYDHYLRRDQGKDGTIYTISDGGSTIYNTYYRNSNSGDYTRVLSGNLPNSGGPYNNTISYDSTISFNGINGGWKLTPGTNGSKIRSSKTGLHAGSVYSEQLHFRRYHSYNNTDKYITLTVNSYVPYNFITSAEITTDTTDDIIYAGESQKIDYKIYINDKTNSATTDGSEAQAYHTIARDIKYNVRVYYEGSSIDNPFYDHNGTYEEVINSASGSLNDSKNNNDLVIPDVNPGTRICVAVRAYPVDSGLDTNWNDTAPYDEGYDSSWSPWSSKCFTVAKKPSFQVRGGSIYTTGNINISPIAVKKKIAGEINVPAGGKAFGSWVEQSVLAYGAVNGLASGSAITTSGNQTKTEYCKLVPLSFANYTFSNPNICPFYNTTGYFNGNSQSSITTANTNNIDLDSLISSIKTNIEDSKDSKVKVINKDNNDYGISSDIDLTNSGIKGVTDAGEDSRTIIIEASNITIDKDIKYNIEETYENLNDIPKLIIYANGVGENGNINIACGVTQIDAILIAKNTIDTCSSKVQLTITGQIIAKTINLNRTYGAGPGMGPEGSATPAEIINYDASSILWNINTNNEDNYQGLTTVYTREVSPRY